MVQTASRSKTITKSVGLKGANLNADVASVQSGLNAIMPPTRTKLSVDGRNGPKTMDMIYDFQKSVVGMNKPDRRIDPGGKTVGKIGHHSSATIWKSCPVPLIPPPSTVSKSGNVPKFDASAMPETLPGHVPLRSPGKLWRNEQAMSVFLPHLKTREGVVPHFYKCAGGWVTIGVGSLVDSKADGTNRKKSHKKYVDGLMNSYNVNFIKTDGGVATRQDVYDDWIRVYEGGKGRNAAKRRAKTRTVAGAEKRLAQAQIEYFAGKGLYRRHPFAENLHGHIQMAIIDTRWNSAGLHPWYGNHLSEMWERLKPGSAMFDPMEALDIFYDAYDSRGKKLFGQYQGRVKWRCERFYEGALAMIS